MSREGKRVEKVIAFKLLLRSIGDGFHLSTQTRVNLKFFFLLGSGVILAMKFHLFSLNLGNVRS